MTPTSDRSFCGQRLRVARSFAGLTQVELGQRVGVTHAFVAYLEGGARQPTDILISAIGEVCGFDKSFFFVPLLDEFRDEDCHFRRRTTTPVTVRTRMLAHGTVFDEFVRLLDRNLKLPTIDVPTIRTTSREEIERAAEQCRMRWGVGRDLPIPNITRALENAGVVVTRFEGPGAGKVDAFSRAGQRPIVVLNTDKGSTSRSRFDMAHELGHLVMHGGMVTGDPDREAEADAFGSAFLLPRTGFVREFPRSAGLDWPRLFTFKKRWGVSLAAIIRRAYDLRLIDAVQYQRGYKFLSAKGWRKGEPSEPNPEMPELISTAITHLEAQGISGQAIAEKLGWTLTTLARVAGVVIRDVVPEEALWGKVIRLHPLNKPGARPPVTTGGE